MSVREIYALARHFSAGLRGQTRQIGKGGDSVVGCGISWLWLLPPDFAWDVSGLCAAHDKIFNDRTLTLMEVQVWWIREAWKASPTWELRLFYALTLPAVLSWTAARYRQARRT